MKKKILVIEDNKNILKNINSLLEEEGYIVFTATNGDEGIKNAKENLPDLIISDILMPGIDGYEVLKKLSVYPSTKAIPFIFLTAKTEKEDIRKGMHLGADDYLLKPYKAQEILNAIAARLKRVESFKEGSSKMINSPSEKKITIDAKLFVEVKGKPVIIKVGEVIYIIAQNQYSSVKLMNGKSFLVRKSISAWEEQLPEKYFLRIHRSTIININYIVNMEKSYNSSIVVYLKDQENSFTVSKRYSVKLRRKVL